MAESDASESRVHLVDLSDQIDAELSGDGSNIYQAEGSLSVQPYKHEPYPLTYLAQWPYRSGSNEHETNTRRRVTRAEPELGGRYGNGQNCWRTEKKQTE